jgi:hypothetical protein
LIFRIDCIMIIISQIKQALKKKSNTVKCFREPAVGASRCRKQREWASELRTEPFSRLRRTSYVTRNRQIVFLPLKWAAFCSQ